MLLGRDKTKTRRRPAGLIERKLYSGTLRGGVLSLKRGARITKTNADGEIVSVVEDSKLGLMVNIGDKLVVSGAGDATVIVTKIEPGWNERLHVTSLAGSVADGPVFILNAKGLSK